MSYSATVREIKFVDPGYGVRGSNKFYRAYVMESDDGTDCRVLFQYGPVGREGTFMPKVARDRHEAQAIADRKLDTKVSEGYREVGTRELRVVPEDLLKAAGVNENARRQAEARIAADPFLTLEAGTDRLIRLVTGPATVQAEAITLKRDLDAQLHALRARLTQAEGSLELATDVLTMKLGA